MKPFWPESSSTCKHPRSERVPGGNACGGRGRGNGQRQAFAKRAAHAVEECTEVGAPHSQQARTQWRRAWAAVRPSSVERVSSNCEPMELLRCRFGLGPAASVAQEMFGSVLSPTEPCKTGSAVALLPDLHTARGHHGQAGQRKSGLGTAGGRSVHISRLASR
eukprot:scaffold3287_cov103-Isochrysis_galbana.AAC.2